MEKKQMIVQRLKTVVIVLGRILAVLSIVFVIYSLYKLDIDWNSFVDPYIICLDILGLSLFVVFYSCVDAYVWKLYVDFFSGANNPTSEVIVIYLKSNIAKYLPGNVIQFVGRNILGKKLKIRQKCIAMATVAEMISLIFVNLILAFVISLQNTKDVIKQLSVEHNLKKSIIIITIFAIIFSITAIFFFVKMGCWEEIKRKVNVVNTKKVILLFSTSFTLYSVAFFVHALALWRIFFILNVDISYSSVSSANALSWLAGYIMPGAPGGIGIRELVLVWLLGDECLPERVTLAAVLLRACVIMGDFLSFLGALFIDGFRKKTKAQNI